MVALQFIVQVGHEDCQLVILVLQQEAKHVLWLNLLQLLRGDCARENFRVTHLGK